MKYGFGVWGLVIGFIKWEGWHTRACMVLHLDHCIGVDLPMHGLAKMENEIGFPFRMVASLIDHLFVHGIWPWMSNRFIPQRIDPRNIQHCTIRCAVAKSKDSTNPYPNTLIREPRKYYDRAMGILSMPTQRPSSSKGKPKQEKDKETRKGSYKRDFDGSFILPMGEHGVSQEEPIQCEAWRQFDAMGVLTSQLHDGFAAPTLRNPVPVGTVVKRKGGNLLVDLARLGDEILVARGGQEGISLLEMSEHIRKKLLALTRNLMRDENDKVLVLGQPGEEVSWELILRVVADVGL
ncbi:hypothetical protein RJ641_028945, partial [Dillenia turbinata]